MSQEVMACLLEGKATGDISGSSLWPVHVLRWNRGFKAVRKLDPHRTAPANETVTNQNLTQERYRNTLVPSLPEKQLTYASLVVTKTHVGSENSQTSRNQSDYQSRAYFLFFFSELCWGKDMVACTKPQQGKKESE